MKNLFFILLVVSLTSCYNNKKEVVIKDEQGHSYVVEVAPIMQEEIAIGRNITAMRLPSQDDFLWNSVRWTKEDTLSHFLGTEIKREIITGEIVKIY